jgi:alkanesulfonate monooxygenase SsuD/methylene tetrahydromethanopterin reductase-like flavin-dependent oxidoreductase (luciferase family)
VANDLQRMRFGVFLPQGSDFDLVGIPTEKHWGIIRNLAEVADAGPFDSICVFDHFITDPPTDEPTFEAWSMMAALATCTSRVRLGQLTTCMGYRNPAYLAKVAACIDVMSGGRLEMGIGAGWYEEEYRSYGYGFPTVSDRLGMLDEGVQIMRQMWTTGTATLKGKHYQVDGAIGRPLPLQDGGSRPSTRSTRTSARRWSRSPTSPRCWPATARMWVPTSTLSSGRSSRT